MTGAMARLVINMFASQGPWTPWQMFCWGLLGFLGGLCFNRDEEFSKKEVDFKVVMGPLICIVVALALGFGIWIISDAQGPFVGWWLYGFGAVGLLAGVLLQRRRLPVDRLTLAVFGFLATFIISVSYTHLDVYKRQVISLPFRLRAFLNLRWLV